MGPKIRAGLLAATVAAISGCVTHEAGVRLDASALSPTMAQSTFVEEGTQVAIVVSTRPMRYRLKRAYIPLEVAVVNKGLSSLTLTRESFTLRDSAGNRYPVVSPTELSKGYGNTDVDRNYAIALPFIGSRFRACRRIWSNFTPDFDRPMVVNTVFLPRFSFMYDFLYFPRPEGDLVRGPLELEVKTPDSPDRYFIRFQLEGRSN